MQSGFFTSNAGLRLRTNSWTIKNAHTDIFFIHGFGEHSARYFSEAKYFNNLGFNFYAYDQRTHGESEGKTRAYIENFDDYVIELGEFLKVKLKDSNKPFFLMSHSMGGLVLLSYLLKTKQRPENFKGAVFSSPFLMPNKNTAPILQKIAGIVAIFLPKLQTVKIDENDISRDPMEQKSYVKDNLNYHGGVYAKSGASLLKQMKNVRPEFKKFKDAFIIQHGTIDQLAEFEGSLTLYNESSSKDKTFIPLDGFRHEITRDIGFEDVRKTFGNWMLERVNKE